MSVILPVLGVGAGVVRYYVDRKEKALTSQISQTELAQSHKELLDLKIQTAPRRLSPDQRAAMSAVLASCPQAHVTLVSRMMDGEGEDFARDLGDVFERAKWKVIYNRSLVADFRGVCLVKYVTPEPPPETDSIFRSLSAAGIALKKQEIEPNQLVGPVEPGIAVFIGRR